MTVSATSLHDAVASSSDDLVDLTRTLIGFRSENPKLVSGAEAAEAARLQEQACQDHIAGLLGELDKRVDRFEALPGRSDVVGIMRGSGRGRSMILNGHVDVVPAGEPSEWPHPPYSGATVERRIWGRGSADMKGGLACAITALRLLGEPGNRLPG